MSKTSENPIDYSALLRSPLDFSEELLRRVAELPIRRFPSEFRMSDSLRIALESSEINLTELTIPENPSETPKE